MELTGQTKNKKICIKKGETMDEDMKDLSDMQSSLLKLEADIGTLAHRQHRTREVEIETLLSFCTQLLSFSARLFDTQTRLMRQATFCACDEKSDSEPECQP